DARNNYGRTPLHLAAFSGRKEVATLLLDGGADVNATNRARKTPLASARTESMRNLLIKRGAKK
ncbi:MAG: ankyrin repeat domain-containing protein, partial [Planctomycetota bacterium]|nr:ankyrin repeat domain-containing protein [Planctomycetota bacterium]